MVNLITSSEGKVGYEVNLANIVGAGLTASPDILSLGGADVEVVEVYRGMDAALQQTRETVEAQQAELESQREELAQQQEELASQTRRLAAQRERIATQQGRIDSQTAQIAAREKQLKVVRLTEGSALPARSSVETAPPPEPDDEGKRPFLQLAGAPASRRSGGPLPPVPVAAPGETLGVVPMDGSPTAATPQDEMSSFHEGYRAFSNNRYAEALGLFAHFLKEHPDHQYADNALFWRGESYLAQGKLLKAIGELERLLRRYPRSEKGPSAMYRIGFAYDRLNDREKASEYYFKVVDRYPGTDAARKASRRVAAIKEAGGRQAGLVRTAAQR